MTTKERMIQGAAAVMAERGLEAASFTEIIERAQTTRGVIYHHFPGGKYELACAVIDRAGAAADGVAEAAAGDPIVALRAYVGMWRDGLMSSDFEAGCPIAAVVGDGSPERPELREAADRAFGCWRDALIGVLEQAGADRDAATPLAILVIASVEGAVLLCRAAQSVAPLDAVREQLEDAIARTIGQSNASPS